MLAVAAVPAILLMAGCTTSHPATGTSSEPDTYGPMPTFLPAVSIEADSELTGTAASPSNHQPRRQRKSAVAVGSSVHATVVGPDVPGEGMPYQTESTTCTWTFTLTGATAVVPVRMADFTAFDHLGTSTNYMLSPVIPSPLLRSAQASN